MARPRLSGETLSGISERRGTPPIEMNLERALEYIEDDEYVEATPKTIRIRKRYLKEFERKRHGVA